VVATIFPAEANTEITRISAREGKLQGGCIGLRDLPLIPVMDYRVGNGKVVFDAIVLKYRLRFPMIPITAEKTNTEVRWPNHVQRLARRFDEFQIGMSDPITGVAPQIARGLLKNA
jgi:hypothetical protein